MMNRNTFLLAILGFSLLFFSCNNTLSHENDLQQQNLTNEKVVISMSVSPESVRTILPTDITQEDVTKAELKIKLHDEDEYFQAYTWCSIQEMSDCQTISLEKNKYYDFLLNLYITKNDSFILSQTGKIGNHYLSGSSSESRLNFKTYYVETPGSLDIKLLWNSDDRVSTIKAGLFTYESDGDTPVENFELEYLQITTNDSNCTATYSKPEVPNGSYFIRFELYANDGTKMNTLEDIIRITGSLETKKDIELSEINTIYNIHYVLNGAAFSEDFEPIETHITNKAVKLPTDANLIHSDSRFAFLGWYTNPDYSEDYLTSISVGTKGDITLYARWDEVTADNILTAINLTNVTKTLIVKEGEEISTELIRKINSSIRNTPAEVEVGLDFSKTNLTTLENGYSFCPDNTRIYTSFYDCKKLYYIALPSTLTEFGSNSFDGCTNLKTVILNCNIPDKDEHSLIFNNCKNFETVFIEENVTTIGNYAFSNCSKLKNITISNTVTTIGEYAFNGCNCITNITIPNSVTSIGKQAFSGCKSLTSITIPNSVTSIGEYAFWGCSSLESAIINCNTPNFSMTDSHGNEHSPLFRNCDRLKTIIFGNTVTYIGNYAFAECSGLTNITIPNSVTSIGEGAFSNCSKLKTANINCNLPDFHYNPPFKSCYNLKTITLGTDVTYIGSDVFSECSGLTDITISENVTTIGYHAFYRCSELVNLHYTGNLERWLSISFGDSTSNPTYHTHKLCINDEEITSIQIPTNITEIKPYAFINCENLTNIKLHESITSIGSSAFSGCSNLTSLDYSGTLEQWLGIEFKDSTSNPTYYTNKLCINGQEQSFIQIPDSLTEIKPYAFINCSEISSFSIPNTITSIGDYALSGCIGLQNLSIPENITNIGKGAFSNCQNLESVTINCPIPNVSYGPPFYNCPKLYEIILNENVTTIGSNAFNGCSGLTNIIIPNSVTNIGSSAFYGCSGLTNITIPNSVTSIGSSAFYGCYNLETLEIHCNLTSYSSYMLPPNLKTIIFGNGCSTIGEVSSNTVTNLVLDSDNLTAIRTRAFQDLQSLEIVTINCNIPNGYCFPEHTKNNIETILITEKVTQICENFFDGCYNIKNINYTGALEQWLKIEIASYPPKTYKLCITNEEITSVQIPSSLTEIKTYAFANCENLTNITIPESITSIGSSAFFGCSNLTSYNYTGTLEQWLRIEFKNSTSNPTYYTHKLCINGQEQTFIQIPDSFTEIKPYTFINCSEITNISIPNSILTIGTAALEGCSQLTSITIPDSIIKIEDWAMADCSQLTSITIPRTTTDLGVGVFKNCYNLQTAIILSNKLEIIRGDLFRNCSSLSEITIPSGINTIWIEAFWGCTSLNTITLPSSISYICGDSFRYCNNLTEIKFTPPAGTWRKVCTPEDIIDISYSDPTKNVEYFLDEHSYDIKKY